mmetsp:Transcript_19244/g.57802  ORF Transcript_19244/g.57802 Transcript_19244/m.57802 type:complete len:201 (-) Transcript_19244:379-981(-)
METTNTTVSKTPIPKPSSCDSEWKLLNSRKNTPPVRSCAIIASVRYIGMTNTASPFCRARFKQCSSVGAHDKATPAIMYVSQQYHGGKDTSGRATAPAMISARHLKSNAVYPADAAAMMAQERGARTCRGAASAPAPPPRAPGRTAAGRTARPAARERARQTRPMKQVVRTSTSGLRKRRARCGASLLRGAAGPSGRGAL